MGMPAARRTQPVRARVRVRVRVRGRVRVRVRFSLTLVRVRFSLTLIGGRHHPRCLLLPPASVNARCNALISAAACNSKNLVEENASNGDPARVSLSVSVRAAEITGPGIILSCVVRAGWPDG